MNETLTLVLAWVAGVVLGAIFFGGLWWTVRKGVSSQRPALWFLGSLLLRMSIALAGFYFVSGARIGSGCCCVSLDLSWHASVVTWLTRPSGENQTHPAQEASHAP